MNKLSLEDCVKSVLTNSKDTVWKTPSQLAKKLIKYGYVSPDEIKKAANIYYSLTPISYVLPKSKKDNYQSKSNYKTYDYFCLQLRKCLAKYQTKPLKPTPPPPPCYTPTPEAPICMAPYSVLQVRSRREIEELGGKTKQTINMENLDFVWSLCVGYGKGKPKFYLSMNGHGIEPKTMQRNLDRLERLGLIKCIQKGRQYNFKNMLSGLTNLASEYELLVSIQSLPQKQKEPQECLVLPPRSLKETSVSILALLTHWSSDDSRNDKEEQIQLVRPEGHDWRKTSV